MVKIMYGYVIDLYVTWSYYLVTGRGTNENLAKKSPQPVPRFSEVLPAHCSSRCSLAFVFGRTAELKVNAPWTGPKVHPIPSLSAC